LSGPWRFCMVATVFQQGYKHASRQTRPHQQVAQTHRQKIKDLLPNRVVGYSPDLAKILGGATIGLFFSQLLFLSDKGANPEGWVYKSEAEMGKETGLSKREQQTARRKLLALGVIAIMRGGWKNTYHFKILWEKLYQVIAGTQRTQTVPTEKNESVQNVPTEPEQNVSTAIIECQQNVSTRWKQNAATHNRENNTEKKLQEKTDRENQTIWENAREQITKDLPLGETADRLNGTTLIAVTDTAATISVPNRTAVPWFERRLYGQIARAMKAVVGKDVDLQFICSEPGVSPGGSFGVESTCGIFPSPKPFG
jgi:transcription initiation factor IIE alpha subunit